MSAREEMLARIRRANTTAAGQPGAGQHGAGQHGAGQAGHGDGSSGPDGEPAATPYRTHGDRGTAQLMDLFAGRLTDYKALVRSTSADRLAAEVAAALTRRRARRVVVPAGLDLHGLDGLPLEAELITDDGLDVRALDACDGAVTGAAVAIAETGTIVLDGSPDQGRRAITLVPDYHLCIVRAEQVVELVPEAITRLSASADRPLTWISGPSATSDIELERVEGVHGPRTLEVILVEP
ncbi:MAG: LUD domain-containing protein [Streptosporangiaceae bacterium]|jgi:L-lactate dehydrogenase complex protein LldG